jgi:hypothetical protein
MDAQHNASPCRWIIGLYCYCYYVHLLAYILCSGNRSASYKLILTSSSHWLKVWHFEFPNLAGGVNCCACVCAREYARAVCTHACNDIDDYTFTKGNEAIRTQNNNATVRLRSVTTPTNSYITLCTCWAHERPFTAS